MRPNFSGLWGAEQWICPTIPTFGDVAMSELPINEKPGISLEQNSVQEAVNAVCGVLLVLSLQLVFRATVMARHWNY